MTNEILYTLTGFAPGLVAGASYAVTLRAQIRDMRRSIQGVSAAHTLTAQRVDRVLELLVTHGLGGRGGDK